MARADSGGFDLVLEVDMAAIQERVAAAVAAVAPDDWTTHVPGLQFGFYPALRISGAFTGFTLEPGPTVVSTSTLSVRIDWGVFGIPDPLGLLRDTVDAGNSTKSIVVTTRCTPTIEDGELWVTDIAVEVSVDKTEWSTVEGIAGYLALLVDPLGILTQFFWDTLRAQILAPLSENIPRRLLIGVLPVGDTQLDAVGQELRVLVTVDGQPGTPRAITRSAIRPAPAGAKPRDLAAVIVGNDHLLRAMIRPALATCFTLTGKGAFLDPHPCYWVGGTTRDDQISLGIQLDTEVLIDRVMAEIDMAGALRTRVYFSSRHASGGFGITGSASYAITSRADADGKKLSVTVDPPRIDDLDIWIEWWVYGLMALGFGSIGLLATGLTDAFTGGALKEGVLGLLTPFRLLPDTLDLPYLVGDIRIDHQPQGQPDAEWQTICWPQPGAPLCIPVSRANDVIVRARG
jgi:hypothetical protein